MFYKNTYSGMFPVKTLFRKTQGTMITSPLYRYYNRVFRVVIRSAIVSAISIMDTFRRQLFSSILLFEDVIIICPSRVAFTYHKNFTFGVYRNLRLDGITFLLSGIVLLLYPFFRSSSLLFSSIGYDLCKVRTHHKQFLQRRNLLYVKRNPVSYRLERHTNNECIDFLEEIDRSYGKHNKEIHLIVDNLSVHKHQNVTDWLSGHQKYFVHFTPTHASWLNQIELWFSIYALLARKTSHRGYRKNKEKGRRVETEKTEAGDT